MQRRWFAIAAAGWLVFVGLPASPAGATAPHPSVAGTATPPGSDVSVRPLWPVERGGQRSDDSPPHRDTGWPSLSADGQEVAFESYDHHLLDPGARLVGAEVYAQNPSSDGDVLVSASPSGRGGNRASRYPTMSPDGTAVAFESYATNLAPHDHNFHLDVYLRNLMTSTTTLVSATPAGVAASGESGEADLSADGSKVVFSSTAEDVTADRPNYRSDIYLRDLTTGVTALVTRGYDGSPANYDSDEPAISDDGSVIVFKSEADNLVPNDDNGWADIFEFDTATHSISRLTLSADGGEADGNSLQPEISGDGTHVAFVSSASNLVAAPTHFEDVYELDRATGVISLVSGGFPQHGVEGLCQFPVLSSDGSVVVFNTTLYDPRVGDPGPFNDDVYMFTVASGALQLISHSPQGESGDGDSNGSSVSGSGTAVAFMSTADDLVAGDNNDAFDLLISRAP